MRIKKEYILEKIIWVLFIGTHLICQEGLGQDSRTDSLSDLIESRKKDTIQVNLLNALGMEFLMEEEFDKSLDYFSRALETSDELGFGKGKGYALKNIGLVKYYQGDYAEVFDYWTRSLHEFERIQDTLGIANMASNVGVIYYDQGSHARALDYYLQSLRYSEFLEDPKRIATALVNIGGVYAQLEEYEKALSYYQQLEFYLPEIEDPDIEATYLMGVGEIYSRQKDHQSAVKYFRQALKSTEDTPDYAHNLTMIGKEELSLGNRSVAEDYFRQAYEIAKEKNLALDLVQSRLALGGIYAKEDPKKAIEIFEEGVFIAKSMEINEELRDIYRGMSEAYLNLGDYKNAYLYQEEFLKLKDSIFNIETDDKIRGLQFDFDLQKKEDEIGLLEKEAQIQELQEKRQKTVTWAISILLFFIGLLALGQYRRYKFTKETNLIIEAEKNRSENLLLNILPEETAQELKDFGKVKAKRYDEVTVLFTDFVGFTSYSRNLEPEELVDSVDHYFSKFDEIVDRHGLEKIKTIGDAYMCAGGLPEPDHGHVFRIIEVAFEFIRFLEESKGEMKKNITPFDVRIGLNTGPVVAGVVGTKKFAYDIWGDTVNVASRMESNSEPGRINVSENTYHLIKERYLCEYRGEIEVKNHGSMKMYFVKGPKEQKD
jgi:class 3 adenylate cyclase/Tfp pilus assembly protein PilF